MDSDSGGSPQLSRKNTEDDLNSLQELLVNSHLPQGDNHHAASNLRTHTIADSPSPRYNTSPPTFSLESGSVASNRLIRAPQQVLVELYDLDLRDGETNGAWVESARWIKYEEDVEGIDAHWGKPHVAFLSFHSLLQLRKCMAKGTVLLEDPATCFADVCDHVAQAMTVEGLNPTNTARIMAILNMKHTHVQQRRHPRLSLDRRFSAASITKLTSSASATPLTSTTAVRRDAFGHGNHALGRHHSFQMPHRSQQFTIHEAEEESESKPDDVMLPDCASPVSMPATPVQRMNSSTRRRSSVMDFIGLTFASRFSLSGELLQYRNDVLLRRLGDGIEAAQVFVGTISDLKRARFVMVRLAEAVPMPELVESSIPIRFVFVILGPPLPDLDYHELGRAIATLMANKHFKQIAYDAADRQQLVHALDEFLDDSVVIPPGEVDSKRLLSGEEIQKALRRRRKRRRDSKELAAQCEEQMGKGNGFMMKRPRTSSNTTRRRFFNGLIDDASSRFPKYWSDIRDAFTFQCVTSIVFMFFASFAPAITFGGLMGKYTKDRIGTIETLFAQCICGVIWGLFSAQPLLIMSATGPVLIFEASLYTFCENLGLDFLTIRLWAGIWILLIATITVALDGSRLLVYVTRFTEDIFTALISTIFIAESLHFVYLTFLEHPVRDFHFYEERHDRCAWNITVEAARSCRNPEPNTALLTAIVLLVTFIIAYALKRLRTSYYLGRQLRRAIGDFGVVIAIVVVAVASFNISPDLIQRLEMPDHISYTNQTLRGHGIIVSMILPSDKWWGVGIAGLAALLVFILLFVETEITELLLMRKDRKLVKGSGMHWDLLLMGFCALLCSVLGLPWMCAAAVQSLAHCGSLTVMKKTAPGERPEPERVIEQRVTTVGVSLLIGVVAFGGRYLQLPVASLFGVFLYLGLMNLVGVQLINRVVLFFIPKKYFPQVTYTESVRLFKMHLYTWIQLLCLALIYLVKQFKQSALAFPFVLIIFVLLRQVVLPRIFTDEELKALDGEDEEEDEFWIDSDFYDSAPRLPI